MEYFSNITIRINFTLIEDWKSSAYDRESSLCLGHKYFLKSLKNTLMYDEDLKKLRNNLTQYLQSITQFTTYLRLLEFLKQPITLKDTQKVAMWVRQCAIYAIYLLNMISLSLEGLQSCKWLECHLYRVLHMFWPGMSWQFSQYVPTI